MSILKWCVIFLGFVIPLASADQIKTIPWLSYSTTYLVEVKTDHHIQNETLLILPDGTAYLTRIFKEKAKGKSRFKNEKRGPFVLNESMRQWLQQEWPKQVQWITQQEYFLNPESKAEGYWLAELSAHENQTMVSLNLRSTGEGLMVPETGHHFILFLQWLQEQIWKGDERAIPSLEAFTGTDKR